MSKIVFNYGFNTISIKISKQVILRMDFNKLILEVLYEESKAA